MANGAASEDAALLREADVQAERLVSFARIGMALLLLLALEMLSDSMDFVQDTSGMLLRTGQVSLLVLLLAGILSLVWIQMGFWRPWVAYTTVTIDAGIVLANVFMNLSVTGLSGDYITIFPGISTMWMVLVISILRMRPVVQTYLVLLLIGGLTLISFYGGHHDLKERAVIAATLAPLFGSNGNSVRLLAAIGTGLVLILAAYRGRGILLRAVEETRRSVNLGRYLPSELASILANRGIDELKAGRRSEVGLLFIDIRNSTSMEETLDAPTLSALINSFRDRITQVARAHGGIIDKFIGDGAFLVFGVVESRPDDAERSIACARGLIASIDRWSKERVAAGDPPIAVGVGVHFGEAFVGAIGNDDRLEFTVLGDAVNVAARLEQATKAYATPLLISQDVILAAGDDPATYRFLGEEYLRGRSTSVRIYAPA